MNKKEVIVEKQKKITNFLQDFGFSFSDANKIVRNKDVKINGHVAKKEESLSIGDVVVFFYPQEMLQKKAEIIFEDKDVCIVYKHAGIETAGEMGLENALKLLAVHRLDRNTEGLVVFAKNEKAKQKLEFAFKKHAITKDYLTEVVGKFDCGSKIFEAFLVKDAKNSLVKVFSDKKSGGVLIKTKVNVLKAQNESSLLEVELLTGKTHQIRAHLAFLGHPIIGDGKYGKNADNKKFHQSRQKLACFRLKFETVGIKSLDNKCFEKFPKWAGMAKK